MPQHPPRSASVGSDDADDSLCWAWDAALCSCGKQPRQEVAFVHSCTTRAFVHMFVAFHSLSNRRAEAHLTTCTTVATDSRLAVPHTLLRGAAESQIRPA